MRRRTPDRRAGLTRRQLLQRLGGASLALPFASLLYGRDAVAMDGVSRRLIVFYFPDGVPGASANGDPSLWHPTGSEFGFSLPETVSPLEAWRDRCVFTRGLSMGPADEGSHPGGAKKLLTAVDGGNGASLDHVLAQSVGASSPYRHLYLGAQANQNGASGDRHLTYVAPGVTTPPQDDPRRAFESLFAGASGSTGGGEDLEARRQLSVIDRSRDELAALRTQLDSRDQSRLDLHLESFREVEQRLESRVSSTPPAESCADPAINANVANDDTLYNPDRFPDVLRAQTDIMVTAMACGLTQVGVLQASMHTSELIMSRFVDTELYDPGFDMRSHQASHYGPAHDRSRREFREYVAQRRWFVEQFAYLLQQLENQPEGEGTMLDYSTVMLCSEVSDGNLHTHSDMPFILAGGGAGSIRSGRFLDFGGQRHGDWLAAVGRTLGANMPSFGVGSGNAISLG